MKVQEMKIYNQHAGTSCYKHCMQVAYYTYIVCKRLNLDYISATRGAMLHDLFLYDWRKRQNGRKGLHAFTHPQTAYDNASKLFDLNEKGADGFSGKKEFCGKNKQIEFAVRMILEQIGIEYEDQSIEDYLEPMLIRFHGYFPTAKEFSAYARDTVIDVDPIENPDETLLKWVNREEALFKLLEQHLIKERIQQGFKIGEEVDVEAFIKFSLSVQNRRKSRAGLSLENHIEALLKKQKIVYSHTPITEDKSKPDFIFPNIKAYRDKTYPEKELTMLGAKSTCKDRWRQVLSEAERIERKHLLTLESAISENQTNEMINKKLQLVLPLPIHETYTLKQRAWLYSVKMFLEEVKEKQKFYERKQI